MVICYCSASAQLYPDTLNKKRLFVNLSTTVIGYSGTMYSLYQVWYSKYDHSSFHFFDDSREWLQMDKAGHMYSSYYLSNVLHRGFLWTGMKNNKSLLMGTGIAFLAMSSIEIFDGYSSKWGASLTDLSANLLGGILYSGQDLAFSKQVLRLKFSFHPTTWPKYRPDALGENRFQQLVKDYNGQTYWLSCNLKSVTGIEKMPSWLNLAIGYSGEGMLGGINNLDANWDYSNGDLPVRYRQFYLSLDADLTQIKTNKRFLKTVLKAFNCLKIPFPSISIEKNNLKFSPLYF